MAEGFDGLEDAPPTGAGASLLLGCGLPAAWAGQNQWRILETAWGDGQSFLRSWAAWLADAKRPRLLHFVALSAEAATAEAVLRAAARHPELQSLAKALAEQCWGLLPGVHRLRFEGGRVLLTLGIGDAPTLLREQAWTVDSIFLSGGVAAQWVQQAQAHALKALARCCRRGTRLVADGPAVFRSDGAFCSKAEAAFRIEGNAVFLADGAFARKGDAILIIEGELSPAALLVILAAL